MLNRISLPALRVVLVLVGLAIVLLGLNAGLGGIRTLGWQDGGAPFLAVTDAALFAVHDNHARFVGAVFGGLGLALIAAAIVPYRLRQAVLGIAGIVVLGGLARFSDPAAIADPAVLPSLLFEIVGFPLLAWWTMAATRPR